MACLQGGAKNHAISINDAALALPFLLMLPFGYAACKLDKRKDGRDLCAKAATID